MMAMNTIETCRRLTICDEINFTKVYSIVLYTLAFFTQTQILEDINKPKNIAINSE
jgi:hypothetical protein